MNVDELISDVYLAANGHADWSVVLGNVATFFDLWTAQVIGVDKRNGHLLFSIYGGKATPQTSLDYFRQYGSIDPRVAPGMALSKDQWLHCHLHFDETFVQQSPFYQQFLIPHGGRWLSGTKLLDDDDVIFLLAFMRGKERAPMLPGEFALMDRFKHHFTEALRNLIHVRETYAQIGMSRELLRQFNCPMFLVDETRGVWHVNAAATALLAQHDVVSVDGGYLKCCDKRSDAALSEAIHALRLSNAPVPGELPRRTVALRRRGGSRCIAIVSAVKAQTAMGAFGHASRALVIIHDPQGSSVPMDAFIVAECFDLTPAEAQVAVQIATGSSVDQIAKQSGVSLPTVRTHLQHALEKTGVARQADLTRLLHGMPFSS